MNSLAPGNVLVSGGFPDAEGSLRTRLASQTRTSSRLLHKAAHRNCQRSRATLLSHSFEHTAYGFESVNTLLCVMKSLSTHFECLTRMHVCWRRLIVATVALPVAAGVVIILVCFVSCPLLWSKLPKSDAGDYYRLPLYVVSAIALWMLFAVGVFCLWRRRKPKSLAEEPLPAADASPTVLEPGSRPPPVPVAAV